MIENFNFAIKNIDDNMKDIAKHEKLDEKIDIDFYLFILFIYNNV